MALVVKIKFKNKIKFKKKKKNSALQKTLFNGKKKCKPQTRIKYEPIKFDKVLLSKIHKELFKQ